MKVGILTSLFFREIEEVHGRDRIIFGGAERYLVEFCRFLQDNGFDVHVFQPLDIDYDIEKEFEGIKIHCIPSPEKDWEMGLNPSLNMAFNEYTRSLDLRVYFATFLAWPHIVRPAITISHGVYWDWPHHLYNHIEPDKFMERHFYGIYAADVCVAVDGNVKRVVQAMMPGVAHKIRIVPNFVDTSVFKPREEPKDWERPRILFPRRLTAIRGCNEFLQAAPKNPQYDYIVCGNSNNQNVEDQLADHLKNTPNIRSIWKPMHEMPQVYQEADIAVIPTLAAEGLSLSLLEAMACGLPIITTPVGGICDAVVAGYNALVYDPDYDSLADYIKFVVENKEIWHSLSIRSRETAKTFDIKIWRARWKEVLRHQ